MHILIIGAAGMIGRKLVDRLAKDQGLGRKAIDKLTLADIVTAPCLHSFCNIDNVVADLTDPETAKKLVASKPDVIFHIAAVVSGEAEANFEKGYSANLDATRLLLEAIRKTKETDHSYKPRFVFTSSLAVYGTPLPDIIGDEFLLAPLSSYGTQKAIGELLISDYSRRGFIEGIGLRLPTICVRPGAPNKAASGFFSNIIREPLVGMEAILPVPRDIRHWFASPRSAIGFLIHAATIDLEPLGWRRNLNMPGLSATVGEQIDALERIVGTKATQLIRVELNDHITKIIEGWPRAFEANIAKRLGFVAETSMDEIILTHIEDELGGKIAH